MGSGQRALEKCGSNVVGPDNELGKDVTMGSVCKGDCDDEGSVGDV